MSSASIRLCACASRPSSASPRSSWWMVCVGCSLCRRSFVPLQWGVRSRVCCRLLLRLCLCLYLCLRLCLWCRSVRTTPIATTPSTSASGPRARGSAVAVCHEGWRVRHRWLQGPYRGVKFGNCTRRKHVHATAPIKGRVQNRESVDQSVVDKELEKQEITAAKRSKMGFRSSGMEICELIDSNIAIEGDRRRVQIRQEGAIKNQQKLVELKQ